jgi:phage-related minor tail protein
MLNFSRGYSKTVAAMILASALVAGGPVFAAADAPAPAKAQSSSMGKPSADPIEARIRQMHDQLHVTEAQAAQWDAVAQVMRDNAKATTDLIKEKQQSERTMSAIEDLRAYQQIAESHAAGVKKLADAFEAFYTAMPDDQKKVADQVFRNHKHHKMQMSH